MNQMEKVTPFIETKMKDTIEENGTYIVGFPFDGTTSFRPGARFGPNALREASFGIETYSPYLERDTNDYPIFDLGNLPFYPSRFDLMNEAYSNLIGDKKLKSGLKLLTLGGEHSISYFSISKYIKEYNDLVIIHLDAHADFRDGYLGDKHSHASIMKRTFEQLKDDQQLIQYGIRSGTKEEFDIMKRFDTLCNSRAEFLAKVQALKDDRPIYLTLDLDYFDPSFFPGTGTPEAGGEDFHSFVSLVKILKDKNLVGADIVELAPMIDATGNSSCFAAKVVREVLLALN